MVADQVDTPGLCVMSWIRIRRLVEEDKRPEQVMSIVL